MKIDYNRISEYSVLFLRDIKKIALFFVILYVILKNTYFSELKGESVLCVTLQQESLMDHN